MTATTITTRWRMTIAVSSLFSCLIFCPFVHECGHLIPAVVSGATVNAFVWTPVIGRAHVSLSNVSGSALPWVNAGGILLPTFVGTALVLAWMLLPIRTPHPVWRLWLLIPGVLMLVGNLGLVAEAMVGPDSYRHMHVLAKVAGGTGTLGKLLELLPAVWTVVVLAVATRSGLRKTNATEPSDATERSTAG